MTWMMPLEAITSVMITSVDCERYVPDFAFLVHKLMAMESIIALFALAWPMAVAAIVLALLGALSVGWMAQRRLGGLTGDVLGATQQKAEILVLLTVAALT